MNNLLQFPDSTIVDKLIPKAQFVKASSTPTAIRTLLADEFEQIRLLYVLRPDTVNVADGNEVKEIDVFYFRCKSEYYSINPFCGLDDLIPRHTIYIIEHGNKTDLLMQHKRRSVVAGAVKRTREVSKLLTDVNLESRPLKVEGQSLYKGYSDAWKKCPWNEASCTIKENHGGVNIHPKLPRVFTAREMARLQSFPDDFIFEGPKNKQLVQIGNAVPPLLGKAIGLAVRYSNGDLK